MAQGLIDGDPQRLGGYWLAGRLGTGGQGVVYEAYDAEGTRVAVKVLHGNSANHGDLRERMRREATAAQRVASFCTARVLGADLDGPRPYIVSEYVEGPDLRRALADGRRFAGGDLHRLATAIATALTAIHEAGVVHRDMKPDNVLLGPDGPRVIDFGIARTLEMSLTSTGFTAGTPTYMAPEVFSGTRAGMPADVFAWGAIMVFAATGADPFLADNLGAVMHRVLSADPDLSALPESLRELVRAALAKDPAGRPTAPELLLALVSGDGRVDMARLLVEGSRTAGGVTRDQTGDPALGTMAEDSYETLSPAERELVPEVFLRLVTVRDDGELVPCRVPRAEILGGRPVQEAEAIERVFGAFSYLLSAGEEVAFTRPALPHAWPRMRAWVRANRDGLAAHRGIATAARRWHAHGRRDGDLMQGSTLEGALHWAATERRNITLTPVERDFLDAGAALIRRRARVSRLVTVAMAVLLVGALVAASIAVWQSRVASVQRDEAEARRIAVVSDGLRATDPVRAMLLSVAAWRLSPVPEARAALTGSLVQREARVFQDPAPEGVRRLSHDGRVLVGIGNGEARAWNVRTGARAGGARLGDKGAHILDAALSPSGRVLAVATEGKDVRLWDLTTGRALPRSYPLGPASRELNVFLTYGEAEDLLAVALGEGEVIWNTATGRTSSSGDCCMPLIARDGASAVTAGLSGQVIHVTVPGGRATTLAKNCDGCAQRVALSRDGRRLAVGRGSVVGLTDPATGRPIGEAPMDMEGWNGGDLRFSPDGALLASVAATGVQVYRTADSALLINHAISVVRPQFAFDPDGRSIRYLDGDTVVTLGLINIARSAAPAWTAMSPDGRLLVGRDTRAGEVRLGLPATGKYTGKPLGTTTKGPIYTFRTVFGRDGRLVAVSGVTTDDETIAVWDTARQTRVATLKGLAASPDAMAISPDGRLLVALDTSAQDASTGPAVILWDLRDGRERWRLTYPAVTDIGFSPDGKSVVVRGDDVRTADAGTGRLTGTVKLGGDTRRTLFTEGGALYAAGEGEGGLALWAPGAARPETLTLHGPTRGVTGVAVAPGGGLAATVQGDGTGSVEVWDLATGVLLGRPVTERVSAVRDVTFSADGTRLLVLDDQGGLTTYPVVPETLVSRVCARAGRDLTEQEWRSQLPDLPYRPVCAP
ncbi:WD40 repeat domain-containing serine/threonine-protein kinase [Sphaerisporangium corydalis]|uniref:Protein kinase n=1 Tax=Sphaerisporangium corydalis TaxID=1441875 RepID=A0ABV9ECW9_9ACTN|nr:WD40 repeat domain-containing serine/threonine-protein kinase [Sphaerisporangium corydalis]